MCTCTSIFSAALRSLWVWNVDRSNPGRGKSVGICCFPG